LPLDWGEIHGEPGRFPIGMALSPGISPVGYPAAGMVLVVTRLTPVSR
jgi:hypothetical protein